MLDKINLRKTIRAQRKNLSSEQVSDASKKIAEKIFQLPEFLNAQHVAFYISNENEIDPASIMQHAEANKKNCYLPVIENTRELHFYLIHPNTKFSKNKFDIEEPVIHNQESISPAALDLIFIPLVAFDDNGNRVGRGGGFYDHALQTIQNKSNYGKPILIGLAYDFQKINAIASDNWDVKINMIITENNLYYVDEKKF